MCLRNIHITKLVYACSTATHISIYCYIVGWACSGAFRRSAVNWRIAGVAATGNNSTPTCPCLIYRMLKRYLICFNTILLHCAHQPPRDLEFNELISLPNGIFDGLASLSTLWASHSKAECVCFGHEDLWRGCYSHQKNFSPCIVQVDVMFVLCVYMQYSVQPWLFIWLWKITMRTLGLGYCVNLAMQVVHRDICFLGHFTSSTSHNQPLKKPHQMQLHGLRVQRIILWPQIVTRFYWITPYFNDTAVRKRWGQNLQWLS